MTLNRPRELTPRDLELIEVALESAISAVGPDTDMANLSAEYAHALFTIRTMSDLRRFPHSHEAARAAWDDWQEHR